MQVIYTPWSNLKVRPPQPPFIVCTLLTWKTLAHRRKPVTCLSDKSHSTETNGLALAQIIQKQTLAHAQAVCDPAGKADTRTRT